MEGAIRRNTWHVGVRRKLYLRGPGHVRVSMISSFSLIVLLFYYLDLTLNHQWWGNYGRVLQYRQFTITYGRWTLGTLFIIITNVFISHTKGVKLWILCLRRVPYFNPWERGKLYLPTITRVYNVRMTHRPLNVYRTFSIPRKTSPGKRRSEPSHTLGPVQ